MVILTSYLLQTGIAVDTSLGQDVPTPVVSLPLDDFMTPALNCLERINQDGPYARQNLLQNRCYGLSSSLAALWTLARYHRASVLAKNPSPLVKTSRDKISEFLSPTTLRHLRTFVTEDPIINIQALIWILRLDVEFHDLDSLTDFYTRQTIRNLATTAMKDLKLLISNLQEPNRDSTFSNSAWIMWNMLIWATRTGKNEDAGMLKARGRQLFATLESCDVEPSTDTPVHLSPCFSEITLLVAFYPQQEFLDLLEKKFPDPDFLVRKAGGWVFGISPSILLATSSIQNLVPPLSPWLTVHSLNMRKTLESLPLWRERSEVAQWLAPFSIMAVTSELN